MAHELDFSKGRAAMFAHARISVWHQVETGALKLDYHPTAQQALEAAGLDYEVLKVPTKRALPDGSLADNALAFSTVRADTGAELGMVGREYTPLQNREALAILDPLIQSGFAVIETAGALRGGADVWVCVAWELSKFGEIARRVFGEDPRGLLPYSVIRNNHNGRSNVVGMDVTICPVCANTLGAGLSSVGAKENETREGAISPNAFAVRHSQNVKANVEAEAARLWGNRVASFEFAAAQFAALKSVTLPDAEFGRRVLDLIAPDPRAQRSWTPDARMANAVVERWENKVAALSRAWTQGAGHTGDRSAWEAYNGAVEVLDHNTDLFPTRSGIFRTQALLDGELGRMKQRVGAALVEYVQDVNPSAGVLLDAVIAGTRETGRLLDAVIDSSR